METTYGFSVALVVELQSQVCSQCSFLNYELHITECSCSHLQLFFGIFLYLCFSVYSLCDRDLIKKVFSNMLSHRKHYLRLVKIRHMKYAFAYKEAVGYSQKPLLFNFPVLLCLVSLFKEIQSKSYHILKEGN